MCVLLQGVYQLKYLYAEHVYGWGAQQVRACWGSGYWC